MFGPYKLGAPVYMPAGAFFFLKKSGFPVYMPAGAFFSSKSPDFPYTYSNVYILRSPRPPPGERTPWGRDGGDGDGGGDGGRILGQGQAKYSNVPRN